MSGKPGVHVLHWYLAKPKSALRVKSHFATTYVHPFYTGSGWRKTLCNIVLSADTVRYSQWTWIKVLRGATPTSRQNAITSNLVHVTCDLCVKRMLEGPPRVWYDA